MNGYNEIDEICVHKAHVFILGAGASIAALPEGDRDNKLLPSMQNFIKTLSIENLIPNELSNENDFEVIYSKLCEAKRYTKKRIEIEQRIRDYFSNLNIIDDVCIYDYLLLSLRPKDIIATFNWDPFLIQCYIRNDYRFPGKLPRVLFLHGNVEVHYCTNCLLAARKDNICPKCYIELIPSKLLYPIQKKNYDNDPYIKTQWATLQFFLKDAYMMTIFGYSAPKSDISAKEKIFDSWRNQNVSKMNFDIVEIIDKPDCNIEVLQENWKDFIYSHHRKIYDNIFDCFVFRHPRRSGEAYIRQYINGNFIPEFKPPLTKSFDELWSWYENRIMAENKG
ncbi:hypothetical protein Lche_0362 [Legionella cherrii]|uniref:SIR2-like domain-containing protein n=1 Tax=Legionella cherrii TaxID=28084 RepID=A0A0W0SGX1_9GAMM|nr:hypothetical protein [Legionella cherrii]KTC82682.1 hypothetical protein Lche_0362 [Legionella cherrii]